MTPPAAAATAAGRSHARRPVRTASPRVARRASGPARTPVRGGGSVALPAGGTTLAPPLGLRIARAAAALPDARLLDRLIRGRLWIGLLAAGLIGIVFMQISLLKLNTGIGRAVQTAQTLDQQNSALRAELSRMAGGDRVQDAARARGYVLPAFGQPGFLDAAGVSPARAAASITKPTPIQQLPLGMLPASQGGTSGVTASAPVTAAGVPTSAASATPPPSATAAAPVTTGAATPTAATPATTAPATQTPAPAPVTPAATPAATAATSPPASQTAPPVTAAAAGGDTAAPVGG